MAWPIVAAMAAGSLIGGKKASDTMKAASAQQADFMNKAIAELEKVGIPSVEAQRIALETPELVFDYVPQMETQFPDVKSAFEEVAADPRLQEQQMGALEQLERRADMGMTPSEKAELDSMRRDISGDEAARQQSILQRMERQGMGGAGAQLAAQLSSSQEATQRGSEESDRMAALQFDAKQSAISRLLEGAGNVRAQDVGEQSQKASAADVMARLNAQQQAGVRQRNVASQNAAELQKQQLKQNLEGQRAETSNVQQQYNKELLAKKYRQEMEKAKAAGGQYSDAGEQAMEGGTAKAKSQQKMWEGIGTAGAGAISAFGSK